MCYSLSIIFEFILFKGDRITMSKVKRIYVEKKAGFDIEAQAIYRDLKYNLGIKGLEYVRLLNRYDVED